MTTETRTIQDFINLHGITMTATFLSVQTESQGKDDSGKPRRWTYFAWAVSLRQGTNQLDTTYRMGLANCKPSKAYQTNAIAVPFFDLPANIRQKAGDDPTHTKAMVIPTPPDVASVLDSLRSDAECYENARSFEDFANDFGYDPDSRKAEAIFNACAKISKDLRNLLGGWELFNDLLNNTERL
jgi:hypothetical protein